LPAKVEQDLDVEYHPNVESMVLVCDVVTINASLHPQTKNMFNDVLIGKMKRGAYLVNCARGKICDRDAVVRALKSGQLTGYAGDVPPGGGKIRGRYSGDSGMLAGGTPYPQKVPDRGPRTAGGDRCPFI
jgi:lactate dehydrogenase-like 2-hydroxyacid dehydrogenase